MVKPIYNALFSRNWQMLGTVFAAGFGFELIYNQGMDKVWDSMNRGRQWKDIRHKYVQDAADDE